jgi:phage shock protein A
MGGSTSDHFGLPLEIGPAALVELTGAVGAARGPVEYGGSDDQAEELAASLTLEVAKLDDDLVLERAARELAERIAERRLREINRLENEVTALRKRVSELETRRVEYSRSDPDAGWY